MRVVCETFPKTTEDDVHERVSEAEPREPAR